jgi:hypothetical protein
MASKAANTKRKRLLRTLEPVLYGDIFDYPPTLNEIHEYGPVRISREALAAEMEGNPECKMLMGVLNGYYFIRGREDIVQVREARKTTSEKAWRKAYRVVRFLRYVPFVCGVLVTGSLAVENVKKKDDLDFLVLVKSRRLWLVFFILGMLQRIFSRRYLCPNYYVSVDYTGLSRRSLYVAREAAQARPIFGEKACRRFHDENLWIFDHFPNMDLEGRPRPGPYGLLERRGPFGAPIGAVEWLLGGWAGEPLERGLKRLLKHRMVVHYGKHGHEVPESVWSNAMNEVELRFHGLDHEQSIYRAMDERRNMVAALLEGTPDGDGAPEEDRSEPDGGAA